jgi:hypothetical protein
MNGKQRVWKKNSKLFELDMGEGEINGETASGGREIWLSLVNWQKCCTIGFKKVKEQVVLGRTNFLL